MSSSPDTEIHTPAAEFQPLYARIQGKFLARIASGCWKPGQLLPNEFQLAEEYHVSQGTIRKALLGLEVEKLITRRQGAGTYVAQHTRTRTLFQFFRLLALDDHRITPTSVVLHQRCSPATPAQAKKLLIVTGALVHAITRLRYFDAAPVIFERIYVPMSLMPELAVASGTTMVEEMYVIYQEQFGVTIARASERLTAVAATAREARLLGLPTGTPLLEISRVALDLNGAPVELRLSRCSTGKAHYAAEVS